MSDLNIFTCTGRLGADPECRKFPDGKPVVSLRVAVSEQWKSRDTGEKKENTLWLPVTITSEGLCRIAEAYLKKGSRVALTGMLKARSYEKDGNTVWVTELHLTPFQGSLTMLDGPSDRDQSSQSEAPRPRMSTDKASRHIPDHAPAFDDGGDDSGIPF
ncbi:MAG: single-stranded DNA-binding protein [Armatimonadia bacterium]|nr:single-stranded DNA-binding protein [Betaproteobacteria bacterium]